MSEWTDIGEQLRKARESKGLDLRDVTRSTRIPLATLSALEDSDYSIFPSPTYARSFLSQYSEFLEVDAHEWIDAFETGDILANIKDHGYLTSKNGHVGEQRHNPAPARRRGRAAQNQDDSFSSLRSGGTSILQTLTVFFVTALLIGGGIYAYKKIEPMLTGTVIENDKQVADTADSTAPTEVPPPTPSTPLTPPATPPTKPDSTPALVAKNEPESNTYGGTIIPTTKKEAEEPKKPILDKPKRTGPPPKALVIEEDEE